MLLVGLITNKKSYTGFSLAPKTLYDLERQNKGFCECVCDF